MSINTRVKRPIIQEGALGPMFVGIEDELQDADLMRQIAATIGNIAENGENQIILIKDGVLPRLIHLASFPHVEVTADASRTYALLSSNAENHVGVFGAADVKAILKLTASEEEATKRDALVALGNISVMIKNQLMIAKLGGLVAISLALDSSFESCQRFACRCMYRLSAHQELQRQCLDSGAVPPLSKLCYSSLRSCSQVRCHGLN